MKEKRIQSANDGTNAYALALLMGLVVQFVASLVMVAMGKISKSTDTIVNLIFMLAMQIAFFLTIFLYFKKTSIKPTFALKKMPVKKCLLCVLIALVTLITFVLPAQWFSWGLEKIGYRFSDALTFSTPVSIVLGALVTVIIAPVVEEIVFRGALLGSLVRKMGAKPAVLLCGLAFSLMHMNPEQTVYQFFLGCVCSYLVICSGNILPAIITHSFSNLLAFLTFFVPTGENASYALPYPGLTLAITFVLLFVGVGILTVLGGKIMTLDRPDEVKLLRSARVELKMMGYAEGKERIGMLGKKGYLIVLFVGYGISAIMWITVFIGSVI